MRPRPAARLLAVGAVLALAGAAPPAHAIGVFLHGFSGAGSSGGGTPGTETMAGDFAGMIPGTTYHGSWRAQADAVAKIKAAKEANPDEPVVLVGHSYGGDSIDEIAETLDECGICVDVYIQIDTVGAFDDTTPSNVKCGYNIYSTSKDGVNGESSVDGSEDIPIDDTTHTDIDDKDSEGTCSDPEYEGKNAYEVVECILDHKLKGKALGSPYGGPAVVALYSTGALALPITPIQPVCLGEALATKLNTSTEDKWFANLDYLDQQGYDVDALEAYVDAHEGLIDLLDASACNLNNLKRIKPRFEAFIAGLPAYANKQDLSGNTLKPGGGLIASPNPFNPRTSIQFSLDRSQSVSLVIYDLRGRTIAQLHDGALPAGDHSLSWDGTNSAGGHVSSGVYMAVLRTPTGARSMRLTLVK